MFSQNDVLVTAKIEKNKKGGSINEILTLMKELISFQEKVEACMASQEVSEHKETIQRFDQHLDEMYDSLVQIVAGGVKNVRSERGDELGGIADGETEEGVEDVEKDIKGDLEKEISSISFPDITKGPSISRPIINAPSAPRRPE